MSFPLQYVRTDRNGTKYFYDWTCPRCAGAGEADKWMMTGRTCFACGGTGKRARPLTVKEYTEEHAAKLEAKRIARQAKYEAEHADEIAQEKADRERREAEWWAREEQYFFSIRGCGQDGIGYILTGNTYRIKGTIKANGGKWILGVWVCPVEIKAKGVYAKRIDMNDYRNEYGHIDKNAAEDAIWEAAQH